MFYDNKRIDFQRCKALIEDFCIDNLMSDTSGEPLYEFEIRDECTDLHPETADIGLIMFLGMLFVGLLKSNRQFGFERKGQRSVFYDLKLREDNDGNADDIGNVDYVDNVPYKAERPCRTYKRRSDADNENDTMTLFNGHIEEDEKAKIRLRTLEKLHNALGISEGFDDVADRLQNIEGIFLKKILNKKTGKLNKYLKGLALTDDGKKLLGRQ